MQSLFKNIETGDGLVRFYYTWMDPQCGFSNGTSPDILWKSKKCLFRFCLYRYDDEPDIFYLSSLWVNEKIRKMGAGTNLVNFAKREVRTEFSGDELRLSVVRGSFMQDMYENLGFKFLCVNDEIPIQDWMCCKIV